MKYINNLKKITKLRNKYLNIMTKLKNKYKYLNKKINKQKNKSKLEELIINDKNFNECINKKYITFENNILKLIISIRKLTIDLNNNEIYKFDCCNNQLEELNINNLTNLKSLDCSNNHLIILNINKINIK